MKIEHEIGSGETYLVKDDGAKERIVCYDFKFQMPFSESRIMFWPKKKADREKAKKHFKETGEILGNLNAN